MDHCGAQFFGAGFGDSLSGGDGVSVAIVCHDARIVDGDIGGALLKVGLRIAASFKECVDEGVSFIDCGLGVVNEVGLDDLPIGDEAVALDGAEFANLHFVDAVFTLGELQFGFTRGTVGGDGAIILCAEAIAESEGAGAAALDENANDDGDKTTRTTAAMMSWLVEK